MLSNRLTDLPAAPCSRASVQDVLDVAVLRLMWQPTVDRRLVTLPQLPSCCRLPPPPISQSGIGQFAESLSGMFGRIDGSVQSFSRDPGALTCALPRLTLQPPARQLRRPVNLL